MRKLFVRTSNYERFSAAVTAVENRGAAEAGMMLVYGQPGYGKSEVLTSWAVDCGAVFLRANIDWTPRYFLVELAKALAVDPRGTSEQLFNRLLAVIATQQIPLVIDEAEATLKDHAAVLEKIRDFSDRTETMVALVGMEAIQTAIAKYPQISSRIAQVVEFSPASLEDVALACQQLCEVRIAPDLAAEIHRQTAGRMREVMNAIATVERVGKMNGLETVGVPAVEGMALTHDWRARRPRVVGKGRRAA
ncbi:MAG: chromosome partitioning protein ParA [Desulfovibrionaceae bacterium CG1_02_65_16]|nr:MAG: chromosome partitioning protein ParA [Desulfovibrionaceae bacterium CG1_02_65_16]